MDAVKYVLSHPEYGYIAWLFKTLPKQEADQRLIQERIERDGREVER